MKDVRAGRRGGLFRRVYVHALLLLAAVALTFAIIAMSVGRPAPWRAYAERLGEQLSARHAELFSDPAALRRELARDREWLGFGVTVYGADGALVASSVDPPLPPLEPGESPGPGGRLHHAVGRLVLVVPVVDGGRPAGYALVRGIALAPHVLHFSLVLGTVLVVLALASLPFARGIARPIEQLTAAAERFGAGDLATRTGIRRRDEVGELAAAFDTMAARIEQLVAGQRRLLGDVSHELRTPLSRMRVALELAAEGDAARAREALAEIGSDVDELERLVDDVLTASRLESFASGAAPGTPLRRARVAAADVLGESAARFRAAHPARVLDLDLAGDLPVLDADAALLRRAFDNLLDNARKYSQDDRPVTLAARAHGTTLEVEVRDRGIGIDAADLPSLFTPFFRTDRSRARGTGGAGLGLALARRIVEAHGGTIAVESVPDEGTTVRVTLTGASA